MFCEILVNNYILFFLFEWEEVLYESLECLFEIWKYWNLNFEFWKRVFDVLFFFWRGFCVGVMVFKFVYFKIFNNEIDMYSLFVSNLFELCVE